MKATGRVHPVGDGAGAHPWADAVADLGGSVRLRDSAEFTPEGRRLLISLGVVEEDPLRVEAERWLANRPYGPLTYAAYCVQVALGDSLPADWLKAARRFRATSWRDAK